MGSYKNMVGFMIMSAAVVGIFYYIFEVVPKPEPLRELPELIVRVRRP